MTCLPQDVADTRRAEALAILDDLNTTISLRKLAWSVLLTQFRNRSETCI
jgi:hypothetical protein